MHAMPIYQVEFDIIHWVQCYEKKKARLSQIVQNVKWVYKLYKLWFYVRTNNLKSILFFKCNYNKHQGYLIHG